MKSDNAIRNGTSIFVGIIVAIAAFVRGALLLPLLLVACSVWGLYVLQHLRGSLPAVPKKKAKAPRRAKFVVPDIEDEPLSDILLLHVNQRITAALRTAGSNITWESTSAAPIPRPSPSTTRPTRSSANPRSRPPTTTRPALPPALCRRSKTA